MRVTAVLLFTFSCSVLKHTCMFIVCENIPNNIWRPRTETNNYNAHAEGDTNSDVIEFAITSPASYNETKHHIVLKSCYFQLRFFCTTILIL